MLLVIGNGVCGSRPMSGGAKLGGNAFICLALLRAADVNSTVANSFRTDPTVTS